VTSANSVQAFQADGDPAEFTAGPGAGSNSITGFGELIGIAVDANGDIYASDYTSGVHIYSHSGEAITEVAVATPANLAVDGHGALYVNQWQGKVLKLIPNEFPVTAATTYGETVFDPNNSHSVTVSFPTNDVYVAQESSRIAWYDEGGTLLATFAGPGEPGEIGQSEGVGTYGAKGRVFVANRPASGLSQVEIFGSEFCEGAPTVPSVSATQVTARSASLVARINPCGSETTYQFEYGTSDCALGGCASVPAVPMSIGDGREAIVVSQSITNLLPNTLYHYRLVAQNASDVTVSADRTMATQGESLTFALSDSRAWEMVSPPDKHGAELVGSTNGLIQAGSDGQGLAYLSVGSIESKPDGNRALERATVLARRGGDGWQSQDITPPNDHAYPVFVDGQGEYKFFSPDLGKALLEQRSATLLSPEASERTPYIRVNSNPPAYRPLVSGKEGFANVLPGTQFGGPEDNGEAPVRALAGNNNLTTVGLRSSVPLLTGAPSAGPSLYSWENGALAPVSILPASEGGTMVEAEWFGSGPGSMFHAIAEDGSRIFWSSGSYGLLTNSLNALYVRDTATDETGRIDLVQAGATGGGTARPVFWGADPQGTVALFTDGQQLTQGASEHGRDLYRCRLTPGSVGSGCSELLNITAPTLNLGEDAEVLGVLSGMSEDASVVYFVARGVLDAKPNEIGESAASGEPNLYMWTEAEGARFIATLSEEDANDWGAASGSGVAGNASADASPSGRYLSFMSERPLASAENSDASTGEPVEQVFRYDAATDRLTCVSCNPTGVAPQGQVVKSGTLVDPRAAHWQGHRAAAILPDATQGEFEGYSLYRPRAILDNGRVFFNAFDDLVPADSNDGWDVYQFEPLGMGDCGPSSGGAATSLTDEGCLSLISSGSGEEEAGFLDASTSGNDVFFLTPAQLNETDRDNQLDVYDARVNGEPPRLHEASNCVGEVCQANQPAPGETTPASTTFSGAGNVKPTKQCPKGRHKARRHQKTACVRKHKVKNHGKRHSGRAKR